LDGKSWRVCSPPTLRSTAGIDWHVGRLPGPFKIRQYAAKIQGTAAMLWPPVAGVRAGVRVVPSAMVAGRAGHRPATRAQGEERLDPPVRQQAGRGYCPCPLAEQACGRDYDPYSERGHVRTQQNFIKKSAHYSRDHPWTRDSARVTAHALDALGRTEEALYLPHRLRNPKPQPVGFLQRSAFVFLRPQSRLLSARLSRMITGRGVLMTLRAL
jgi:hypothetical protein